MADPRVILVELHLLPASPFGEGDIVTYRYFETVSCPDRDRWQAFLQDLTSQLAESRLGVFPARMTHGDATGTDLVIELRNIDYGRPLVEECLRSHQIALERPIVPERWRGYRCTEYFADGWWDPKRYHPETDFQGINDYTKVYEDFAHRFLAIGTSGCDGIDFGFRQEHEGLWACYPGENFFKFMAPTVAALHEGWSNGSLSV